MSPRFLPLASLLSLAACTTPPSPSAASPSPPAVTAECQAEAAQGHVGKVATSERIEAARRDARANTARTLKPGQMVTMEYLAGRLNVDVDARNVIIGVRCG